MRKTAQFAYGTAGASFAIILALLDKSDWWREHSHIAWMLGFSIPSCVVGAWGVETRMSEHKVLGIRYVPHVPEVMMIGAWCGIAVGLAGISAFLLSISERLGFGFIIGILLYSVIGKFISYGSAQDKVNSEIEKRDA